MGLDVSVYKYTGDGDFDALTKLKQEWDEFTEILYEDYRKDEGDEAGDARKERALKASKHMDWEGLSFGENPLWDYEVAGFERVEGKSAIHPDHLFGIGYWRSSYNASGLDRILSQYIGTSMGELVGNDGAYEFVPDWEKARERIIQAKKDLENADTDYSVYVVDTYHGPQASDEAGVLAIFKEHKNRERPDHPFAGSGYSSMDGHFHIGSGMTVEAMIPMKGVLGGTSLGLVIKQPLHESYFQSLDIMVETCDHVLSHDEPERFYLHWSG